MLVQEIGYRSTVYNMIKIAHYNELFLSVKSRSNEVTKMAEKQSPWTFLLIERHKVTVMLRVGGVR